MSQASIVGPVNGPLEPAPAPSTTDWGKGPPEPEITQFLSGPQKRGFELGRAIGIFFEILGGFRKLHFLTPCVTVFGSARFTEDHAYYGLARKIGQGLARAGFTVMTGGGSSGKGSVVSGPTRRNESGRTLVGQPRTGPDTSTTDWGKFKTATLRPRKKCFFRDPAAKN